MTSQNFDAQDSRFAAEFAGDVTVERIAAVYAEAFLNVTEKSGETESAIAELDAIVDEVLKPHPRFAEILGSNIISHEEKVGIIDRVFKGRVSQLVLNFLKVLSRRGRLDIFLPIVHAIHEEFDRRRGIVPVRVVTAAPLDEKLSEQLATRLRGLIQGEPRVSYRVDPRVIGGIVIEIGDKVIDASVSAQLERLKKQIIDRSAHEIQSRRDRLSHSTGN
ncbi:MAG: ATP synthase F1 subunit delta [Thermogutta sp.]|nr:ATP synthase F1 subunit delta [Thermogutta sp.]HPU07329.1 ATP synthase F1 subunit delta [Thermogutta sp.]